jgi:hypothetical protein
MAEIVPDIGTELTIFGSLNALWDSCTEAAGTDANLDIIYITHSKW